MVFTISLPCSICTRNKRSEIEHLIFNIQSIEVIKVTHHTTQSHIFRTILTTLVCSQLLSLTQFVLYSCLTCCTVFASHSKSLIFHNIARHFGVKIISDTGNAGKTNNIMTMKIQMRHFWVVFKHCRHKKKIKAIVPNLIVQMPQRKA